MSHQVFIQTNLVSTRYLGSSFDQVRKPRLTILSSSTNNSRGSSFTSQERKRQGSLNGIHEEQEDDNEEHF